MAARKMAGIYSAAGGMDSSFASRYEVRLPLQPLPPLRRTRWTESQA
jgi:hypothetical protein